MPIGFPRHPLILLLLLPALFLFAFPGEVAAQPETDRRKEMLILHSYHPGLP